MATNPHRSAAQANAAVDAQTAAFNSGTLKIYDGSQPASVATAITTQNLLVTLAFGSPAFAAAVNGAAAANALTGAVIGYSGTASWFRAFSSGGTALWDGTVGTASADCIVPTTTFTAGVTVNATSVTYSEPM